MRGGGFGAPSPALPDSLLRIAPNRPGANDDAESSLKQALLSGVDGTRTRFRSLLQLRDAVPSFV